MVLGTLIYIIIIIIVIIVIIALLKFLFQLFFVIPFFDYSDYILYAPIDYDLHHNQFIQTWLSGKAHPF
jgi:hypothetical protein